MKFYNVESDFYDLFYFSSTKDIPIYRKHLCPKVLELFTGTGRILYYLNPEYGAGLDINERMLSKAKENLKDRNVRLIKADARNFDLGEEFCLIIIGINSLLMFPKDERIAILKSSAKHLSSGGVIIVDLLNPYLMVEGIVHHGDTIEKDGNYYSRFFVPRWEDDHWNILYFYDTVIEDIVHRKYASLKIYPVYLEDLEKEAKEAGLEILEVYGDYDMSEFKEESDRIIAVMGRAL